MKLKKAGAIKKVFYSEWLANTVVVKKKGGKWRVCVDFIKDNIKYPWLPTTRKRQFLSPPSGTTTIR